MVSLLVSLVVMVAALFLLTGQDTYSALGLIGIFLFLFGFAGFSIWLHNALSEQEA